jgi:hypothetical protein
MADEVNPGSSATVDNNPEQGAGGGVPNVPGQQQVEDDLISWKGVTDTLSSGVDWVGDKFEAVGNAISDFDPFAPFKRMEQQISTETSKGLMDTNQVIRAGGTISTNKITAKELPEQMQYTYEPGRSKQNDMIDHRIRLRPFPKVAEKLYGEKGNKDNLLDILYDTNGVIFPFTPTLGGISHNVNYTSIDIVHTNQEYFAYKNTEALKFTITGQFSANNYQEARYMLACMHFLRSCTKMHYGGNNNNDSLRGLPPPVLLLSGYGTYIFNDLPVILTNVTFEYPNTVDMVPVIWTDNNRMKPIAWVPILQTISVSVTVQNTPSRLRQFDFDSYIKGALITSKPGGMI